MNSKQVYSSIGGMAPLYGIAQRVVGYDRSVDFFVSQLPFGKNDRIKVLDAGCGNGLYTLAILKQYPNSHVTAFDLEKRLITPLQHQLQSKNYVNRANVFVGDIKKPPLEQNEFDLIITAGVLEYVPIKKVVSTLSRLLRSKGYFFNSPVRDTWWGHIVANIYACKPYSRKENLAAFEREFELKKIINLPWYIPASFKEALIFQKI